jgi:chemotaxis methyl-accepting protein methylase
MNEPSAEKVFLLSRLAAWIEKAIGLQFPEAHHDTIVSVARTRCETLGINPLEYEDILKREPEERSRFLSLVTIGETYFFRDERQFKTLVESILPRLLAQGKPLRAWSATCASGEEAVSLLAAFESLSGANRPPPDFNILATDVNRSLLDRFRKGVFPASAFRGDGRSYHPLLDSIGKQASDGWILDPAAFSRLEIRELNLLDGPLPQISSMDLVLFRNTLVYMRPEQKTAVIDRIVPTLKEGGILFVASPEVPALDHPRLQVEEIGDCFYFKKCSDKRKAAGRIKETFPSRARSSQEPKRSASPPAPFPPAPTIRMAEAIQKANARFSLTGEYSLPSSSDIGGLDLPDLLLLTVSALNKGDFTIAAQGIDALEKEVGDSCIGFFLEGLINKYTGKTAEAVEAFERAHSYNPHFWPALFHAGMALSQNAPGKAVRYMSECLQKIELEPEPGRFSFLFDDFDIQHIRRIAEKVLGRGQIAEKDGVKWHS